MVGNIPEIWSPAAAEEDCSRCYSTEPPGSFHLKWIKGCLSAASPELVLIVLLLRGHQSSFVAGSGSKRLPECLCGDHDIAAFAFWTLCCIVMLHTRCSSTSFAMCEDMLSQFCVRHIFETIEIKRSATITIDEVLFQAKIYGLKLNHLLLFLWLNYSKLNIFGFWKVGWTCLAVRICYFGLARGFFPLFCDVRPALIKLIVIYLCLLILWSDISWLQFEFCSILVLYVCLYLDKI